jgi:hypothetical protein
MPPKWQYDGSINRFPIRRGEVWRCADGAVAVNDLYEGLPAFMTEADCVFVDPPYNAALENGFRTKAGLEPNRSGFGQFLATLFGRIDQIAPATLFCEIGRQNVGLIERFVRERFPHVDTYHSTYYGKSPCFVIRGGRQPATVDYEGIDEAQIIDRICEREPFQIIADPCMGRGLVGLAAHKHGRQFRGTELNPARLAVLVAKIHDMGGKWQTSQM